MFFYYQNVLGEPGIKSCLCKIGLLEGDLWGSNITRNWKGELRLQSGGVSEGSGELGLEQGNFAGNLGGKAFQHWGLDGSQRTGPGWLVRIARTRWAEHLLALERWNPHILESK